MNGLTCCFIGHRDINKTKELKAQLYKTIENLIVDKNVTTFLFGSKSDFNGLCYETVTGIREKYPHIKRVFVRAEYQFIDESYTEYLRSLYEETCYPEKIGGAGKLSYVERNFYMIDNSDFCVFYYSKAYAPQNRKSGTETAYNYAKGRKKEIINLA